MQKFGACTAFFISVLVALAFGFAGASELDGQQLVQLKCADQCHSIQRIQAAEKPREQWQSTLQRMIRMGARLNQDEKEAVLDHLSAETKQ